jgi:putative ABC transport system permease protein
MLVITFTMICSVLAYLNNATSEKSKNFKAIVTNKWQIPSRMPWAYAADLRRGGWRKEGDVLPKDSMTWQFYIGSLEKDVKGFDPTKFVFAFVLEPKALLTMMDDLEDLDPASAEGKEWAEVVAKLEKNRIGIILGETKLEQLQKKVGDRLTVYSVSHKEIDLEFEIVGSFPKSLGRYATNAAMNNEYMLAAYEDYQRKKGKQHPLFLEGPLGLVWLRLQDRAEFERLAAQMTDNPLFSAPPVKLESASSGIASFIEPYRDILWAVRWLLAPAILFSLSLVLANAISISVRERQKELAVMKVIGFRPWQLLALVLGEAVLLGAAVGVGTIALSMFLINRLAGGIQFPIAFLSRFYIPADAWWWGLAVGGGTALVGALLPAWSARNVKVTEVFSKVS